MALHPPPSFLMSFQSPLSADTSEFDMDSSTEMIENNPLHSIISLPTDDDSYSILSFPTSNPHNPSFSSASKERPSTPTVFGDHLRMDINNASSNSKAFRAYLADQKYTFYSQNTDVLQEEKLSLLLEKTSQNRINDECFWLDVTGPSLEDLNEVAKHFLIHPLTIEDISLRDNREKCEIFDKYYFLCFRTCDQPISSDFSRSTRTSSNDFHPSTMFLLIFPNYIISFHHEPSQHVKRILKRLYSLIADGGGGGDDDKLKGTIKLSPDWVMYSFLDDTIDEFVPFLLSLEEEVDSIDENILFLEHCEQSDMLRRIGHSRKRVTSLLRLLRPKIEILKSLTKRCYDLLQPGTIVYLRDVNDHVLSSLQLLEKQSETLNRSHSNYIAQLSLELSEASNRMNIVMKKLTVAAAIMLPVSVISGLWGMNVPVPFGVESNGKYTPIGSLGPFVTICSSMLIVVLCFLFFGAKQKWW